MKELTQQIKSSADVVRTVSTPKGHGLKNIAGRIAEIELRTHGFYTYTKSETGEKVLITLTTS